MINFDLLWTWKQLKISFLVVLLYMWAWIGEFLLLYLIWYYICYEFTPYMALRIWHFCRWKTKVYYFCRKIIRYGISVAKISTNAPSGQRLRTFSANLALEKYRDIIAIYCIILNYREIIAIIEKSIIAQGWSPLKLRTVFGYLSSAS